MLLPFVHLDIHETHIESLCAHCSSDNSVKLPFLITHASSAEPVAEKAQQDPHYPWSFTEVTAFFFGQSKNSGTFIIEFIKVVQVYLLAPTFVSIFVVYWDLNSSGVRSVNLFIPRVKF
jgi:hypothetical protein